jgi:integrase
VGVLVRQKYGSYDWWIFINHNGRRRSKKIGRDKATAEEVAKKIEDRPALGDLGIIKETPKVPILIPWFFVPAIPERQIHPLSKAPP